MMMRKNSVINPRLFSKSMLSDNELNADFDDPFQDPDLAQIVQDMKEQEKCTNINNREDVKRLID